MANIKISELNELGRANRSNDDYVPIVDSSADETKKISIKSLIQNNETIIGLYSTAPISYNTGDKYYNTVENKIYTATSGGWTNPETPIVGILYVILSSQLAYVYDSENETLISVGGGSGGDSTPTGQISMYAGSTAPTGWLICDGSAISRTTYSNLYNVIGNTYGSGDGSTTFNLPNLKGKVAVGLDGSDTSFDALGETGGTKTVTLTTNQIPAHSHQQKGYKVVSRTSGSEINVVDWGGSDDSGGSYTRNAGGGQAHNNLQPYIVLNYIIKI